MTTRRVQAKVLIHLEMITGNTHALAAVVVLGVYVDGTVSMWIFASAKKQESVNVIARKALTPTIFPMNVSPSQPGQ